MLRLMFIGSQYPSPVTHSIIVSDWDRTFLHWRACTTRWHRRQLSLSSVARQPRQQKDSGWHCQGFAERQLSSQGYWEQLLCLKCHQHCPSHSLYHLHGTTLQHARLLALHCSVLPHRIMVNWTGSCHTS